MESTSFVNTNQVDANRFVSPENSVAENPSAPTERELRRLARVLGVQLSYFDAWGQRVDLERPLLGELITALGADARSGYAIRTSLLSVQKQLRAKFIAPVKVHRGTSKPLNLFFQYPERLASQPIEWTLVRESGESESGIIESADRKVLRRQVVEQDHWLRCRVRLPFQLPAGYHRFEVRLGAELRGSATIIVGPERCYVPEAFLAGKKVWGIAAQLYSLRSDNNDGIGDLLDLEALIQGAAQVGADLVGINPIHARRFSFPDDCSPYSPSSRGAYDPIYINVDSAAEYLEVAEETKEIRREHRESAELLRKSEQILYNEVARLKWACLTKLKLAFESSPRVRQSERRNEWDQFSRDTQSAAYRWAVFEALETEHVERGIYSGFPSWADGYQSATGSEVSKFAVRSKERIQFFLFLQWLVQAQLVAVKERCAASGMSVGIYGDLALGSNAFGGDVWSEPQAYMRGASLGAPPDELNLLGQNWGLPPFHPRELRARAYAPFVQALRAAMRFCGAIRIDHAMSLMRVYCVPSGRDARYGGYIRYPLRDLLTIVALESVRSQCMIIGEDLGTVPEFFRVMMAQSGMLSYRLLMFSKNGNGEFLAADQYPAQALVTFGTHDVATIRGFFEARDIAVRRRLQLFPNAATEEKMASIRASDISQLEQLMRQTGEDPQRNRNTAIQQLIAETACWLQIVALEDLVNQLDQVNMPGVVKEYPSWRQKLAVPLEELFTSERFDALVRGLRQTGRNRAD